MKNSGGQGITIRRILYASDFSENSRAALDYAKMFALRFEAKVYMLHVVLLSQAAQEAEIEIAGPSLSREAAEHRLETLAEELRTAGVQVETHIVDGFAGDVIPRSILTYDIDLLVLGIHGLHHGLTYLLMGSTTEILLRESSCPVLTVGANVLSGFNLKSDLDQILFVSDLSPQAAHAAPLALFLGKVLNVPVKLGVWLSDRLHDDQNRQQEALEEYCGRLRELIGGESPEWCQSDFQRHQGLRTEELVAKVARDHDSLVILGIHSLDSSFARLVLSRSSSPVITILQTKEEAAL